MDRHTGTDCSPVPLLPDKGCCQCPMGYEAKAWLKKSFRNPRSSSWTICRILSSVTLTDPAVASCSIMLIQQKKPVTVARSGDSVIRLDESQYPAGEGPCLSSMREQIIVHLPDLTPENRWTAFTAAAREAG